MRTAAGVIAQLYRSWCKHRGGALAAELLLFSLLSFLPLLLSVAALVGALDGILGPDRAAIIEQDIQSRVVEWLGSSPQVLDLVDNVFSGASGTALTVGVLFSLYAASRGFVSLVGSLDVVFSSTNTRGWLAQRLVGIFLGVCSMVLLPVVVVTGFAGRWLATRLTDSSAAQQVLDWAMTGASAIIATCWVTTLYHLAPRRRLRWRTHLPGALVCVGATIVVTELARRWTTQFGPNPLYGAIGVTLGIVWWAYFVCCAFYVGAEVTLWHHVGRDGRVCMDQASTDTVA